MGECISDKTLLIISGSAEAVPGIEHAKDMGFHVVVSDGNPNAPGFEVSDDHMVVSTYDVEATIEAARKYHRQIRPINGVTSVAADVPLTVASVAAALGIPGIPIEVARLAMDKLAMKRKFAQDGIPIPWFSPVESVAHLRQIVAKQGYPLVLKPVDSRGARGVLRLTPDVDLVWAFKHSYSQSPSGTVMVEEYLAGSQISTESVILDEVGFTPGFSDRNYEYIDRFAPYMIENGGQQPSSLGQAQQETVIQAAERAAISLGITTGVAKGDLVMTPQGPKVIEIAARLSGGWFCTDQIPLGTGVDLMGTAFRIALGEKVSPEELLPRYHRGVAIRYFFPQPGKIIKINNIEKVENIPWVHRLDFFLRPGEILEPVTNHTKRAGFVITIGDTREQAVERALQVVETIHIETVPE